jgi:hypothetical protein
MQQVSNHPKMGVFLPRRAAWHEPSELQTQTAAHGPECAGCTRMKVVDSLYTCSKHGNRLVYGNGFCDGYASVYEQKAMEIIERHSRNPPVVLGWNPTEWGPSSRVRRVYAGNRSVELTCRLIVQAR